jgi:hypothetical protein
MSVLEAQKTRLPEAVYYNIDFNKSQDEKLEEFNANFASNYRFNHSILTEQGMTESRARFFKDQRRVQSEIKKMSSIVDRAAKGNISYRKWKHSHFPEE